MKVYVPMWFKIKTNPQAKFGARHMFQAIQLVKDMDKNTKRIVKPIIQRNAYFAHSESILISMISDENETMRELGWRRIKKFRDERKGLRSFAVPKLNFSCSHYSQMIEWNTASEPPLTMR